MKKIILCFSMVSFSGALKANTGSFLKPLREEFPTFVQTVEKETPLFIKFMDRKSFSKFQWFKKQALDAAVFSSIHSVLFDQGNIPKGFIRNYAMHLLWEAKFINHLFFNFMKKTLRISTANLVDSQELGILDSKITDLFLFFACHETLSFYDYTIRNRLLGQIESFKENKNGNISQSISTIEMLIYGQILIFKGSIEMLKLANKNDLKKRILENLKKEKEIFLQKLNLLIQENPQSFILDKIYLQVISLRDF